MPDNIKRSELLHFSHIASGTGDNAMRDSVLILSPEKRAELVETAIVSLYRHPDKSTNVNSTSTDATSERDEMLSLIQTIVKAEPEVANNFEKAGYVICNKHLVITFVNSTFLNRSEVTADEILGKSLYFEREYEGSQIEQLYSMVMETRLMADALVRYDMRSAGGTRYDGWFVLVVIPLDEGGIGVISRFANKREEIADEIDLSAPDAPRFILL